ncbi:hypothetical protein TNIN_146751 [Trichonephila inaurata madagascariensis]|uniref:Uncharacterized protein n=1 Tax=Trichonephila inaurata madagascariensis TaxID=2747483 RepID=A0A8X6XYC4_9ARAC|nr:hypothetical protein TNIN_146751 [Trichonephila inaurata madagascariensis]
MNSTGAHFKRVKLLIFPMIDIIYLCDTYLVAVPIQWKANAGRNSHIPLQRSMSFLLDSENSDQACSKMFIQEYIDEKAQVLVFAGSRSSKRRRRLVIWHFQRGVAATASNLNDDLFAVFGPQISQSKVTPRLHKGEMHSRRPTVCHSFPAAQM